MFGRKPKQKKEAGEEGVELQSLNTETSPQVHVAKLFRLKKNDEIAKFCLELINQKQPVANLLNKLTPNEKKELLTHWREKAKEDPQSLLLVGCYTPLFEITSDEGLLSSIENELKKHGTVMSSGYHYWDHSNDELGLLRDKVHIRIALSKNSMDSSRKPVWSTRDINLEGFRMPGNYSQLYLSNDNLSNANLQNMDGYITGTKLNLTDAVLDGSKLKYAAFEEAKLIRTSARNTNLFEAYLNRADCEGADFRGANLSGSELMDTNFRNANLSGTDLRGVKNLYRSSGSLNNLIGANLLTAKLDSRTRDDIQYMLTEGNVNDQNEKTKIKPFTDYFASWKDTHGVVGFFQRKPPIEKCLAALYLMGATSQADFDKRYGELPESVKKSRYANNSFEKAAIAMKNKLEGGVPQLDVEVKSARRP